MSDMVYVLSMSGRGDGGNIYLQSRGKTGQDVVVTGNMHDAMLFETEEEAREFKVASVTYDVWQVTPLSKKKMFNSKLKKRYE